MKSYTGLQRNIKIKRNLVWKNDPVTHWSVMSELYSFEVAEIGCFSMCNNDLESIRHHLDVVGAVVRVH